MLDWSLLKGRPFTAINNRWNDHREEKKGRKNIWSHDSFDDGVKTRDI